MCNKLHLIKNCLCCFLDIHLFSKKLPTIATISSLKMSELFTACISCMNNFNLLHNYSSGSYDKITVFEIPEAETIKPGDFGNFISL